MKRVLVLGALATVGLLIARTRVSKLRERLEARCQGMFEQMPETFPPKRALNGIEEIRHNTARIVELLEAYTDVATKPETKSPSSTRAHPAA